MKMLKRLSLVAIFAVGLFGGVLLAALHSGRLSLADLRGSAETNRSVVKPICNPIPPPDADLDGELPGGG